MLQSAQQSQGDGRLEEVDAGKERCKAGWGWPRECLAESTTVFSVCQGQGAIPKLKIFY